MTKYAIKAQDGKYFKLVNADVQYNAEHYAKHGTWRIGVTITKTPYNYKTREYAEYVLKMINAYVQQNDSTADVRAQYKDLWRQYKYIDRQKGCYIEEI